MIFPKDSILNQRETITIMEFHIAFGYPIDTIRYWLKKRLITHIKGREIRIITASLKKFLESKTVKSN